MRTSMGSGGVPPKKASERRRRNKTVEPKTIKTTKSGAKSRVPPLPKELVWSTVEQQYWTTVWSSPMATMYLDADHPALMRMTRLAGRAVSGELGVQAMSELRQLEDRFGLSPMSRRRMQIEIEPGEEGAGSGEASPDARWLHLVG